LGTTSGLPSPATMLSWFSLGGLTDTTGTGTGGSDAWTFSAQDKSFDYLAAGETVTLTYTVQVDDGHGGVVSQPVTITVTGTNDTPAITSSAQTGTIAERSNSSQPNPTGSTLPDTASGAVTFTDVDLSDHHTVAVTGVATLGTTSGLPSTTTMLGWLSLGGLTDTTGTGIGGSDAWSFSAQDKSFDYLAAGETVTLTYTVQVDDGHGGVVSQPVTITVTGTNDTPVITSSAQTGTIAERSNSSQPNPAGSALPDTASGAVTFTDVDLSDHHTVTVTGVATLGTISGLPSTATMLTWFSLGGLTDTTGTGTGGSDAWSFSAQDKSFDYLAAGETVTLTYTVQVDDGHGGVVTQPVTITVTGTNDTPVITSSAQTGTIAERSNSSQPNPTGSTLPDTASGAVTFTDVDLSNHHTVAVTGVATLGTTSGLPSTTTMLTWLSLGPLTDTTGTGIGGSDAWSFSAQDKSFDYLAAGETVTLTYAVQVNDGHGGVVSQPVTITVTGTNDTPAITSSAQIGTIAEIAGALNSTTADTASGAVTFTDVDLSDHHTVTVTGVSASGDTLGLSSNLATLQSWLSLSPLTDTTGTGTGGSDAWTFSAQDKSFDYLAAGETVTLTYTVQVNDGHGGVVSQPVTITVTGTNDAPVIVGETDPTTQTVILARSPVVLAHGVNTNSLGLDTETFDDRPLGSRSFFSSDLDATFTASGNAGVVHGTSSGSTAPFVGSGHADTTNYLGIGGDGTETITFAEEENAFGLYWGSVDAYNTINFYNGTTLVASYTGADISPLLANGDQASFASNGYVEFSDLAPFNKVVLASSANAFEVDNVSAGFISDSHIQLASPITGTLTISDADIGDTLTASVIGNAVVKYDGSTTLPSDANVAALIDSSAVKFDSVTTTGGLDVLHWTYSPTNADLDFLEPGDTLTVTFQAQVSDGHAVTADQSLTVTIVGTGASVVNGTAQNDTFVNVGGGVTIFGQGGQDTFVFKPNFGSATIADFDATKDTIDIDHTLFNSVSALLASAQVANSGHDIIITDAAHDTITLKNVNMTLAQLATHQSDFHIT
jgi:VCBS repeat-containing protein